MKKYLFIYGPLGGGGAERVLLDILNNFDYSQFQVDLCVLFPGGVLFHEIPKEVHIIPLYSGYTKSFSFDYHLSTDLGIDYFLKKKLKTKLKDEYDIIISFLEGLPLKLHALTNLHGRHYSWVHCDLYNFPYEKGQFHKGEELRAYNKMNKVVCVAQDTANAFKNRFPECITDTLVLYNPIDIDKVLSKSKEKDIRYDKFTVIIVGRLTLQKRIDRIIRLARRLKEEHLTDIQFIILGEGELRGEIEKQISALDVTDMIQLLGFKKNPFPYIKAADMMLISSMAEGFSLVTCEAMVLGIPVLSTKTAGPIEILDKNEYGLLCDHDDESIYQAFIQLFKNKSLRLKYSHKAKERIKAFNVHSTMKKIYEL